MRQLKRWAIQRIEVSKKPYKYDRVDTTSSSHKRALMLGLSYRKTINKSFYLFFFTMPNIQILCVLDPDAEKVHFLRVDVTEKYLAMNDDERNDAKCRLVDSITN